MCKLFVRVCLIVFCISLFHLSVFAGNAPANDDTSGSVSLTLGLINTSGTVVHATATTNIPTGCSGAPNDDVWYRFALTTYSKSAVVSITGVGSSLASSGVGSQLFSLNSSGALVSSACGTTS